MLILKWEWMAYKLMHKKKRFDVDIQSGCKQIVEGKGFSATNPLVDLDVFGFSDLMHLFHFYKGARISKALTHWDLN